jgi:hypothetical protein
MDNRADRDVTSRLAEMRVEGWKPPETLPMPKPQPGWVYRWVRLSMVGQPDPTNVSTKLREGWEPVMAKDHPEITLVSIESERFKDNVVIGGLMLCKAPAELMAKRDAYYGNQLEARMNSANNELMQMNDPRMPLFNQRQTKITFGNGS